MARAEAISQPVVEAPPLIQGIDDERYIRRRDSAPARQVWVTPCSIPGYKTTREPVPSCRGFAVGIG